MSNAPAAEVVRVQARKAYQLAHDLTALYDLMRLKPDSDPLHQLTLLFHQCDQMHKTIRLLRNTFTTPGPKRPINQRDCPGQIPLFEILRTESDT